MKKLILTLLGLALIVGLVMAEVWPPQKKTYSSDRNGSFLRVGGTSNDTTAIFVAQLEERFTEFAYMILGDSTGMTRAAGGSGADTIPDSVNVAILFYATLDTTRPDSAVTWKLIKGDTLVKVGTGFPSLVVGAGELQNYPFWRFVIDGQSAGANDSMNWTIKTYFKNDH